jgi:DNA-binding transcriptional MerR regulator
VEIENKFSIGEVCKILGCEQHNLRYIEKVLELSIERENNIERSYTIKDIETLKFVFDLKEQGLNYRAIKKVLEKGEEVAATCDNTIELYNTNTSLDLSKDYDKFIKNIAFHIEKTVESIVVNTINTTLENYLVDKMEPLQQGIMNVEKKNDELKLSLEEMQAKHFKEIDEKLMAWRQEQFEKEKKGFWARLFKRR